ncbi:YbaK/EbsC family protein [Paracoccaceae bacterium GXU_MW_L88]
MSKSLKRVRAAAETLALDIEIEETSGSTRTAAEAAAEHGCDVAQIAKSILFHAPESDRIVLFLTSGAYRVDLTQAEALIGEPLAKADAALIRERTGFAIGGVSPIGSSGPVVEFFDRRLLDFPVIYPAAGTPRHTFAIAPQRLAEVMDAQIADFSVDSDS